MKRNRILWFGLWILSLVGISFYGGPVTYGIFTVLSLVPVFCLIYARMVYNRFRIYQQMEGKSLVCRQNKDFVFDLQNEDFFPYAGIRIVFYSDFSNIIGLDSDTVYELKPFSGINLKTGLICRYSGNYDVGVREIIIYDFLKIFSLKLKIRNPFTVNVRPRIIHLDNSSQLDAVSACSGNNGLRKEEPDIPVREYVPGDDVRQIRWKQTARTGKLMVFTRTSEAEQGVGIITDSFRYGDEQVEYLPPESQILELNIALVCYFLKKNMHVRSYYMTSGRCVCEETTDLRKFEAYYEKMCAFSFNTRNTAKALASGVMGMNSLTDNNVLIFIVCKWTDEMMKVAGYAYKNNIPVTVFLVSDDSGETEEICNGRHGIRFVRIGTEDDLTEVLR